MGLFFKEDQGRTHYILKLAFERIKNDMNYLFHWVNYFHQKHIEHDQRLARLEQGLNYNNYNNVSRQEVHSLISSHINSHSSFENISRKIQEINARLDQIEAKRLENQASDSRVALKERLMKKITQNSKEYLKSVVLGLIKKYGRIPGPQLKEIVVEEQGICSKSSFYRLLDEIEKENSISSMINGKEEIYFFKEQIAR